MKLSKYVRLIVCLLIVGSIARTAHASSTTVIATAVRTANGHLKVILWQVAQDGQLHRLTDSGDQAGEIRSLAVPIFLNGMLITTVSDANHHLKLISWHFDGTTLTRLHEAGAGEVTTISAVRISDKMLVTAVKGDDGKLKLIAWRVDDDGAISRLNDTGASAGYVNAIELIMLPEGPLVSVVSTAESNLKLIAWSVDAQGAVSRLGEISAGAVSEVSAAFSRNLIITAVREANGKLKVITWSVKLDGTLTRLGDSEAGTISLVSTVAHNDLVITSVSDGALEIITWQLHPDGQLTRLADSGDQAGAVNALATIDVPSTSDGVRILITAVQASNNNLKLVVWQVESATGKVTRLGDSGDQAGIADLITVTVQP